MKDYDFVPHMIARLCAIYGFLNKKKYIRFCEEEVVKAELAKNSIDEKWRPVKGYEELYEISDFGRVRNKKRNSLMKISVNKRGYPFAILCKNGIHTNHQLHHLVWDSFTNIERGSKVIDHKNEVKIDSRLSNLQLMTQEQNYKKSKNYYDVRLAELKKMFYE